MSLMHPQEPPYRLYVMTVDARGRRQSEGPYTFPTAGDALEWIKRQTTVTVIEATLFLGDEVVAEVR